MTGFMLVVVVHLVRAPHPSGDRVIVSLRADADDGPVRIAVPGRTRVTGTEVAARLARLVDAAAAHARATGRGLEMDLDRLLERATVDVAERRPMAPAGD